MHRGPQQKNRALNLAGLGCVLALFYGCASTLAPPQIPAQQDDIDRLSQMQALEAVQELERFYTQAEKQNLSVFAPEHYRVASQAVVDARQLLLNKEPIDKIATKVAVAEAVIRSGAKVTDNVAQRLVEEVKLRDKLLRLRANETYSQDFDSLAARLNRLIQQLENGKTRDVEAARPALVADMNALAQRAARYNALNEPETILRRVKRRGGDELIPVTFAEAQAVLQSADNFIKANPQNIEAIEKLGEQALFAARRALFVADEVAALQHNIKFSLEQVVLDEEYRLNQVSRHLADADVRDNPLEVQAQKIAEQVARLKEKASDSERLVNVMRQAMAEGEDANDKILVLSEELQRLEGEKNAWTAKEALFNAKLQQLNAQLSAPSAAVAGTQDLADPEGADAKPEAVSAFDPEPAPARREPGQTGAADEPPPTPEAVTLEAPKPAREERPRTKPFRDDDLSSEGVGFADSDL